MSPENKANTIFKKSPYGLPSESTYQKERLSILSGASKIAGVPLYFGEWNKVSREQDGETMIIDSEASNIIQSDVNQYINIFTVIHTGYSSIKGNPIEPSDCCVILISL